MHHVNCPVAHILEPQTFSNLHSAESEQLDWRQTGQWGANSWSKAIFWQSIPLVLTGCMLSQGFPQKNSDFEEKQPKIICYSQSQCCPQPHNHCHFCYKIKGNTLLEAWIYCILGPIQGPEKDVMLWISIKHQVFNLKYKLTQFVLMYQSQKSNYSEEKQASKKPIPVQT